MKRLFKTVSATIFGFVTFQVFLIMNFFWNEKIHQLFTGQTIVGFSDVPFLLASMPEFILYFLIGWFVFTTNSKYIWSFVVTVILLKIYFITHIFTEHSSLLIKIWSYFSYLIPAIASILGNKLNTKRVSSKTSS